VITGEGTGAEKEDEGEDGGSAGKALDPATCLATIDTFAKTIGPEL
jgi:hypothetical protein